MNRQDHQTQPERLPPRIGLSHGSGGRDMQLLLEELVLPALGVTDDHRNDMACLPAGIDACLAVTTDSYTVDPLVFPGGDIGSLAVNGTINDLAVGGAVPAYLSCALIIEEGLETAMLARVLRSMREAADGAGVQFVTGDTKVVHRGAADKLFINTCGIGRVSPSLDLGPHRIQPGDAVLVSGPIGDHGAAILGARGDLQIDVQVQSDCRPLHTLAAALIDACPGLRCMRDATRGGLAAVLNEFAQAAGAGIRVQEADIPVRAPVRGACEILGLDPLHLANEGTLVAVVAPDERDAALQVLQQQSPAAACIGQCHAAQHRLVSIVTSLGGERVMDMPAGELLPRIC